VGKLDSAALRILLQRVEMDYISLRVNGLVPVQSTQELLVDSWEESSHNFNSSCAALAAIDKKHWYLIGTQQPILVLDDNIVNRFPLQTDGNWFYTASPICKRTHAVVFRKGSNSVTDIRSFVRILSGGERVYRHIDKIYTHASTHAQIATESDFSPLPYNASLPDLDSEHVRIDIPVLPKIVSFEHVFVNYTFTGIKAKASNATFFIRNIKK
jgi:predicted metalloenzyme YecM